MSSSIAKFSRMFAALPLCAALMAGAFSAQADLVESHPDWETVVGNGKTQVSIPSGQGWIAYESDMQYINKFASGKLVLIGALILDDVETGLKASILYSTTDNGTVIKRGNSTYNHIGHQYGFLGTLIVEEGTFLQKNWYPLDGCAARHIYVRSGATYHITHDDSVTTDSVGLSDITIHLAGTGVGNGGALILDANTSDRAVSGLVLDDDATVTIHKSGFSIASIQGVPSAGRNWWLAPGILDLNGHNLTIGGSGEQLKFKYLNITNSVAGTKTITVNGLGGSTPRTMTFSTSATIADNVTFVFPTDTTINFAENFTDFDGGIQLGGNLTVLSSSGTAKTLNGVISGTGSVTYGTTSSKMAGSLAINARNTYTGTTTLNGGNGFVLAANYPTAIPDYTSKLTVASGSVTYRPGFDAAGVRWTADEVLTHVRDTQITAEQRVATIDTTDLVGQEFVLGSTKIAAYFPNYDIFWNATGTGAGRYTLEGPYTTAKPLNLKLTGGTVRVTGTDQINLGDALVSGTSSTAGGTLILDGAKDVVFGDQIIYIGKKASGDAGGIGRMVVTNSTIRSTGTLSDLAKARLWVGAHAPGILEIENGAVVSNQVHVGGGGPGAGQGYGAGAIYQRGGLFAPIVNDVPYKSSALGFSETGFYQLEGGLCRPPFLSQSRYAIGAYATSVSFIMTGGRVEAQGLFLGMSNCSQGQRVDFHQLGGEIVFPDADYWGRLDIFSGGIEPRIVFLTIAGEGTRFHTGGNPGILFGNANNPNRSGVFNLNDGGVLETRNFQLASDASTYEAKGVPLPMVLNMNGGVLKALVNNECIFGPSAAKGLSKVSVYEKGMTIDTAGVQYTTTEHRAITAAGAGGIQSVTLAAPVEGLIAPQFRITSATGYGASLVPLFDTVTRTVTNVYVASHGWGYTASDTIALYDGTGVKKTLAASEFTIADNVVGGFTKQGAGTLKLYNENTWAQWTKVTGGTLQVMTAGAIPNGTALTLSNDATLDFNNLAEPTFTGLDGTGGTAANGVIKLTGAMTVSAKRFVAGTTTDVKGTVDVSALTSVTLTDTDVLEAVKNNPPLHLIKATTVTFGATPPTLSGAPQGWKLVWTAQGLRLSRPKGFVIIAR